MIFIRARRMFGDLIKHLSMYSIWVISMLKLLLISRYNDRI